MNTIAPCDFGAPSRFNAWREGQDQIFWDIVDCQKRHSLHNGSVGCGKSLSYITAALVMGKRVAVVTESKGLQDQLHDDFGAIGLYDMRGLANYTCKALSEGGHLEDMWRKKWGKPTCEHGPCTAGLRCDLKDEGCDYFDDWRRAFHEKLVSTNYAYWIAIHKYSQGLGKFDIVIFDEAHAADSQLSSALTVEFTAKDVKELGSKPPKVSAGLQSWRMWGRVQQHRIQGKLDFFASGAQIGSVGDNGAVVMMSDTDIPDASELKFWKKLEGKCKTLSDTTNDWIIERDEVTENVRIAPAWVRKYAEDYLFLKIPRVIMMSATIRPKTAELLDIPEEDYDFYEYPSQFPVEHRPIYWVPTVSLNYASPQEDLRTWVVRIDNILARRLDRKGIIHTVSYPRQQYLLEHSRFRHIMHPNNPKNTKDVVKSFRNADAPAVLISPSVGTGFDFPFELARYQIISKIPFKDARGAVLRAQASEDPHYLNYLTSQDLIQMYGRTTRDPKDWSETIIVDDQIEWFLQRYSGYQYDESTGRFNMCVRVGKPKLKFFPEYFTEAFQRVNGIPDPPALDWRKVA